MVLARMVVEALTPLELMQNGDAEYQLKHYQKVHLFFSLLISHFI